MDIVRSRFQRRRNKCYMGLSSITVNKAGTEGPKGNRRIQKRLSEAAKAVEMRCAMSGTTARRRKRDKLERERWRREGKIEGRS